MTALEAGPHQKPGLPRRADEMQLLVEGDQLTGLNNRYYRERYLGDGASPADPAVMMVDIDGRKRVKGAFGHGAGDAVLPLEELDAALYRAKRTGTGRAELSSVAAGSLAS